jgi:hypothetical protein
VAIKVSGCHLILVIRVAVRAGRPRGGPGWGPDRHALDRLKEIAAQADPDKVAWMMAHVDAQAARLLRR